MKFYAVVNYYLVSLTFKFHADPCINKCAQVVSPRVHVTSQVRAFATRARAFMPRTLQKVFGRGSVGVSGSTVSLVFWFGPKLWFWT